MISRAGQLLTVGLLLLSPATNSFADATVSIDKAWVREAPPAAKVLAAYMVFTNSGAGTAVVTSIESPDFSGAEIHQTIVEEGLASMLPVARLEVPAGQQVALEPGGMHLMLFNPVRRLREGDSVTLLIHGAGGWQASVKAPVVRYSAAEEHRH